MSVYYLDASALVKRYLWEPGSRWLRALFNPPAQDNFASTELITVEIVCALARAERARRINLMKRDKLAKLCLAEVKFLIDTMPVSAEIQQNASQLALRHPLRAYDAAHLASVLELARRLMGAGLSAPIFVTADAALLAAARAEGLAVEDPNAHE